MKKLSRRAKFEKILTFVITLSFFEELFYSSFPNTPPWPVEHIIDFWEIPVIAMAAIMFFFLFKEENKYNVPDDVYINKVK